MSEKLRRMLPNLALALASVAFTLGMLELAAPWLLPRLPLKLHFALDRYQRVLAQTSKQGVVPQPPYVLILGDSYAAGLGDWLVDSDPNTNPPYHSAHVLADLLGQDVVSFGKSGDSSMGAYVKRPFQTFRYLESTRFAFPEPELMVAYFYEGNDLEDNLRDLGGRFDGGYDASRLRDPSYFEDFLTKEWVEVDRPWRWRPSLNDRPIVTRIIRKTLTHAVVGWPPGFVPHPLENGTTNQARMQDGVVNLPEPLQSAAVGLAPDRVERGLYTFEQSMRYLRRHGPQVPLLLVFIPAPVTAYPMSSPSISALSGREGDEDAYLYTRQQVAERSDYVCDRLARVAEELELGFLDSREGLWPAARERFLHGPKDWGHFNRDGYELLARTIAPALASRPLTRGRCVDVRGYFASIPQS